MGEALAVDTLLHLVALGIALGYGYKNRRWRGAALAVGSPVAFVTLIAIGPWEDTGPSLPTAPTAATLIVAYVIANVLLALGLFATATPTVPSRSASRDQDSNGEEGPAVSRSARVALRRRNRMVLLVAAPLLFVGLVWAAIAVWWKM